MTAPRTPDIERRIDALARRAGAMRLIEEVQATPDECIEKYNDQGVLIEWTMRAVRPEGPGWSVKDIAVTPRQSGTDSSPSSQNRRNGHDRDRPYHSDLPVPSSR